MDCALSPDQFKPQPTRLMTWPEFANGVRDPSRPVGIDRRTAKTRAGVEEEEVVAGRIFAPVQRPAAPRPEVGRPRHARRPGRPHWQRFACSLNLRNSRPSRPWTAGASVTRIPAAISHELAPSGHSGAKTLRFALRSSLTNKWEWTCCFQHNVLWIKDLPATPQAKHCSVVRPRSRRFVPLFPLCPTPRCSEFLA